MGVEADAGPVLGVVGVGVAVLLQAITMRLNSTVTVRGKNHFFIDVCKIVFSFSILDYDGFESFHSFKRIQGNP